MNAAGLTERQLEIAARELCRLRGNDPDQAVGHEVEPRASGFVPLVLLTSLRWELAASEIRDFAAKHAALSFALSGRGEQQ